MTPTPTAVPLIIKGYEIDAVLLQKRAVAQCDVRRCRGSCCRDGVWLSRAQAATIREHAELIAPYINPEQRDASHWFSPITVEDPQFPPCDYVATTIAEQPAHPAGQCCVFWRQQDGYCGLQAASLGNGLHKWTLKPDYCALYPIADDRSGVQKRVIFDEHNAVYLKGSRCGMESGAAPEPLFQTYAEEMALLLGEDGYRALCAAVGEAPRL